VLTRNLMKADERKLVDSLPGVKLYQGEFDVYVDFVGQFGIGNWRASRPCASACSQATTRAPATRCCSTGSRPAMTARRVAIAGVRASGRVR